jgi:hypothetical protein
MVDKLIRVRGFASTGDRIVICAGSSLGTPGRVNAVVVHTVGEDSLDGSPQTQITPMSLETELA